EQVLEVLAGHQIAVGECGAAELGQQRVPRTVHADLMAPRHLDCIEHDGLPWHDSTLPSKQTATSRGNQDAVPPAGPPAQYGGIVARAPHSVVTAPRASLPARHADRSTR